MSGCKIGTRVPGLNDRGTMSPPFPTYEVVHFLHTSSRGDPAGPAGLLLLLRPPPPSAPSSAPRQVERVEIRGADFSPVLNVWPSGLTMVVWLIVCWWSCFDQGTHSAAAFVAAPGRRPAASPRVSSLEIVSTCIGLKIDSTATEVRDKNDDDEDDLIIDEEDLLLEDAADLLDLDYTGERQKARDLLVDDVHSCILPKGIPDGFYVVEQHEISAEGFDMSIARKVFGEDQMQRVGLKSDNVTSPAALMMIDAEKYPTVSKARKALRKGYILLHRGPLEVDSSGQRTVFDPSKCIRARVKDRVYPNDVICEQARLGNAFYPIEGSRAPFELPVVYEDDHFAIVNKPPGFNVNSHRKSGTGRMCVRAAAPYVLKPPKFGTLSIIRRPSPVHRLDKPTQLTGHIYISATTISKLYSFTW